MKLSICLIVSLTLFSCKKSGNTDLRLSRTEAANYFGYILHTEYSYDDKGRIINIKEHENNAPPVVMVSITYNGNEATLLSFPKNEPLINKTKEVRLLLDGSGKMLRKIGYIYGLSTNPAILPIETFTYDTLVCTYDAAGFLKETKSSLYDSARGDQDYSRAGRLTSMASFTTQAGNVTNSDEQATYTTTTRQGGVTTISGGSSEYHYVFNYSRSFPNQTDFKNTAVLNEYRFYYEPFLDINYKHLPDRVTINSTDRDLNGVVNFTINSIIEMERAYNAKGLLSSVNIPSNNTQYRKINYFYD
jgi:hypothetical protein